MEDLERVYFKDHYFVDQSEVRGSWGTRFGFLIALWFAAVGVGNVWRFPWQASSLGGGAFVVPYMLFILILSLPAVMAEGVIGKYGQGGPVQSFRKIGGPLRGLGISIVILNAFVAYSIIVAGHALVFSIASLTPLMNDPASMWNSYINNPTLVTGVFILIVLLSVIPPYLGVNKGIEKFAIYMGVTCIIILVVGALRAVTLPGAWAGIEYYLKPDWPKMFTIKVLAAAMAQAYFSFGPGWSWFLTLSSYARYNEDTGRAQMTTGLADTSIALLAGFCVLPVLFAMGLGTDLGTQSSFVALPMLFGEMAGGRIFTFLFFLAFFFAAYTCEYVLVDVTGSFFQDAFQWPRKKSILAAGALLIAFGLWPTLNETVFNTYDTLFGLYFLPMAVTLQAIAAGWIFTTERFRKTVMNPWGNGYIGPIWDLFYKWVTPGLSMFLMIYWAIDMTRSGAPWYLGVGGMAIIAAVLLGSMYIFGQWDKAKEKRVLAQFNSAQR